MTRTQIYLTDKERKFFKNEAEHLGICMADAIRRALDQYIEKNEEKPDRN